MRPSSQPAARPRATLIGSLLQGWSLTLHAPWVVGATVAALFALGAHDTFATAYPGIWPGPGPSTAALVRIRSELLALGLYLNALTSLPNAFSFNVSATHAVAFFGSWIFVAGGILDRLARGRAVGAGMFFWACGHYFGRMLRLWAIAGVVYWGLFRWVEASFGPFGQIQGNRIDVLLAVACLIDVVFGYASVRLVIEDRRSALGALAAALRFIRRRFLRVGVLYAVNLAVLIVLFEVWPAVRFDVLATFTTTLALAFYLLLRTWARLSLVGSAIAFFQGELAHAHYTAAPPPVWPDSPAAEAIDNLRRLGRLSGPRRDADGSR